MLIHQLPAKPAYARVKVWRRLQALGAVTVKGSVYALPANSETREDLAWLAKEIVENGGEAMVCEATLVEGLSNAEASLDTCGDADDVFVDAPRRRVYVSCGEGAIDVFGKGGSGYERLARIPTVSGARMSFFATTTDRLYLGVRASEGEPAAIWVFRPQP